MYRTSPSLAISRYIYLLITLSIYKVSAIYLSLNLSLYIFIDNNTIEEFNIFIYK